MPITKRLAVDKFKTLVDVLEDYFQHMDDINEKRIEYATREVNTIHKEVRIYELLKRNLQIIKSDKLGGGK